MLLEDKIEIKIDKIEYLGLENSNNPQVRVNIEDTIENISIDRNKLSITVSRRLECTPKCMFNIYASFIVDRFFDLSKGKIEIDKMKDEILKDPNKFVRPVFSLSSSIISNLISASGNLPIITPPGFTNTTKNTAR